MKGSAKELCQIAVFVALLAVSAWISIPIGAVPITLQTLAVALAGLVLGAERGMLATFLYLAMGFCGIPVFAGFKGGAAMLLMPTGGFLFGLPVLSFRVGLGGKAKGKSVKLVTALLGLFLCYLFGAFWLQKTSGVEGLEVIFACVLPFIIPDIVKIVAAYVIAEKIQK